MRAATRVLPTVVLPLAMLAAAHAGTGSVQTIAPDVYFHEGDHSRGLCNNTWIVLDDYVVVIDANYPAGASEVIPLVKSMTQKPVRFVVDTHFHPDHSFGNAIWADAGATLIAQAGALDQLRKFGPDTWAKEAGERPDVAASRLNLPSLVYTDSLVFEDARHRVELRWPGAAHTLGDTLVWLPHEKVLVTGDLTVNGAFNYLHDSSIRNWIQVLGAMARLGATTVVPGHGPLGGPEIIADQQRYFVELEAGVQALHDQHKTLAEAQAAAPELAAQLKRIPSIARYVPADVWFVAHVEKMYDELK